MKKKIRDKTYHNYIVENKRILMLMTIHITYIHTYI